MMPKNSAFAEKTFELGSLTLNPLRESEAQETGRVLAAMEPWRTLGYRPDAFASYLLRVDPSLSRYSAQASGKPAGIICIRHPWLLGPYIETLALFDSYQKMGLGREIISWIEGEARGSSRNIWATVSSFNTKARSFYKHFGFVEASCLKDLVKPGYDEILIRKQI